MRLPACLATLAFAAAATCATGIAQTPASSSPSPTQTQSSSGELKVYFVDVEGGQATLFVTPQGESLLIDTGWPGRENRDADRILRAAHEAGLAKIDFVLITHYHDDHVGGVPQLLAKIPVGTFIDHGPNRELDHGVTEHGYAVYQQMLAGGKSRHIVAKPGDVLPIAGMRVTVVSGDGAVLDHALPGAGESNPACKTSEIRPLDNTENARSLGVEITFGKLRLLDLGDLTWDKERGLVCPVNKLGRVDVLVVSHHGWKQSSSPALIDALHARVAVMDNGETKGGSTPTFDTLSHAPGLETLWQLHASAEAGTRNTAAEFIANPLGTEGGFALKLAGKRNGSFAITNERTGFAKTYRAR